ncbi:uncharacterized protein LY79DRAFT_585574 [Colletotrichum navitas]|uniref:Uncharacterized protein n=1 Tax=Colletotrichum navitas TaxID=681940 RepID=A0AAD8UWF0_9PEZI|nr:uncharacterized protein LY79DRAFT_585574 [Colletotrichum navitas]KAK1561333.1 hypothetical protein LY79DRAFT_585574 [Colletotrichum navitas]
MFIGIYLYYFILVTINLRYYTLLKGKAFSITSAILSSLVYIINILVYIFLIASSLNIVFSYNYLRTLGYKAFLSYIIANIPTIIYYLYYYSFITNKALKTKLALYSISLR